MTCSSGTRLYPTISHLLLMAATCERLLPSGLTRILLTNGEQSQSLDPQWSLNLSLHAAPS